MARRLPLIFAPQPEGGFVVTSPALPELLTESGTLEEGVANVKDALAAVVELYADLGRAEIIRSGDSSHRKSHNLITDAATVLPDRGGRDLKPGTLHAAVRQLGLDWQESLTA